MVAKKGGKKGKRTMRKKSNWGKLRTQRGGTCAARGQAFQRGGSLEMAPFGGATDLQMDQAAMVQAQSYGQIQAIDEAQVLARQATQTGGRRRNRSRNNRRNRSSRRNRSRNNRRNRSRNNRRSRSQRGGMAPIDYELRTPAGADMGMNPQFRNENAVNPLYGEFRGAQGY